jgi:hypothetical protein
LANARTLSIRLWQRKIGAIFGTVVSQSISITSGRKSNWRPSPYAKLNGTTAAADAAPNLPRSAAPRRSRPHNANIRQYWRAENGLDQGSGWPKKSRSEPPPMHN